MIKADESLAVIPYIDSLVQSIMDCDTPMTIAIQGDWGSGKTSMMNLIDASIEVPSVSVPGHIHRDSQERAAWTIAISLFVRRGAERTLI
jgi:hypothetical protein